MKRFFWREFFSGLLIAIIFYIAVPGVFTGKNASDIIFLIPVFVMIVVNVYLLRRSSGFKSIGLLVKSILYKLLLCAPLLVLGGLIVIVNSVSGTTTIPAVPLFGHSTYHPATSGNWVFPAVFFYFFMSTAALIVATILSPLFRVRT